MSVSTHLFISGNQSKLCFNCTRSVIDHLDCKESVRENHDLFFTPKISYFLASGLKQKSDELQTSVNLSRKELLLKLFSICPAEGILKLSRRS